MLARASIVLAAIALLGASRFSADRATEWTQFRNGGGLNAIVSNSALPARLAWRFNGPAKGTSTSPVVAGKLVLIAANDHVLYALDGTTGAPVWQWRGDNEIMSAPVYRHGIAAIGTGNADSPVWDPPEYNIVGVGPSDLNGIDLQTGKRRWTFALTGSGMPMPALVGNRLLHIDGSGVFLALDIDSGKYLWRRIVYSNGSMTNVLVGNGGLVYFDGRFPNAVYALSADGGRIVWAHAFPKRDGAFDDCPLATDGVQIFGMYATPLAHDPRAFVIAGVKAHQHVYALDAKTGVLRWDTTLAVTGVEPRYNESAIPMYENGTLYDGSPLAPVVTALDARTGRPKWALKVSGPVKGGMVERDGVLYFGDLAGRLWAVEARTGRPLGSVQTDLRFNVGSPIVLNDSLVIGSQQGPVIAVPLDSILASRKLAGVTNAGPRRLTRQLLTVLAIAVACLAVFWLLSRRMGPGAMRR